MPVHSFVEEVLLLAVFPVGAEGWFLFALRHGNRSIQVAPCECRWAAFVFVARWPSVIVAFPIPYLDMGQFVGWMARIRPWFPFQQEDSEPTSLAYRVFAGKRKKCVELDL